MTNPPVPATSLDVEACVQLLTIFVRGYERDARHYDDTPDADGLRGRLAIKARLAAGQLSALASALPGMGKDSDEFREACRAGGIACAGEREAARDEGRLDDAREWGRFAGILHARVGPNR